MSWKLLWRVCSQGIWLLGYKCNDWLSRLLKHKFASNNFPEGMKRWIVQLDCTSESNHVLVVMSKVCEERANKSYCSVKPTIKVMDPRGLSLECCPIKYSWYYYKNKVHKRMKMPRGHSIDARIWYNLR